MTQKEYIALVDKCKQLSYEYYVLAQPTVTDAQFDALVSEIEQAEAEHPEWTLADSPTQMVGSDVDVKSERRLIRHRTRMLSCQKAQTQEAVKKWMNTTEKKLKGAQTYVLEWKYDGISCSLVYQDGRLTEASTRGEKGIMGQDILPHVSYIASVPQTVNLTGRVEVRGEIVCPKSELASLGYKDCRTAAAALMNQMVPSRDCRNLVFLAWQMDVDDAPIATESMSMVTAQVHRFMGEYCECKADEICAKLDEFEAQRNTLPYPTDGVVIKIDCRPLAASLGCTEHHPKGSIAYKFSAQKAVTRCIGIEICVGETGKRTPRALLEPVMIVGREVKAASLGSERVWHELGVTEGCLVEVGLSNDVTPKIYRVIEEGHTALGEQGETLASEGTQESTEITENAGYTSPAESVPTDTIAEPVREVTTTDSADETDNTDNPVIAEMQNDEPVSYNNDAELERLQQENERLQACIAEMERREQTRREESVRRAEEVRKAQQSHRGQQAHRNRQQCAATTVSARRNNIIMASRDIDTADSENNHAWLKTAGYLAAASVALLVIWQTGLLIPIGLIGLGMSGIIK